MLSLIKIVEKKENKQIYLISYLYGMYYSLTGNYLRAKEAFKKIINNKGAVTNIHLLIGKIYLAEKDYQSALVQFHSELKHTGNNPLLFFYTAFSYYNLGQYSEAIGMLLKAISIQYDFSEAHYYLGLNLFCLNQFSKAEKAFQICLLQDPNNIQSLHYLRNIYKNHRPNNNELSKVEDLIQNHIKEEIIVVSGLPRSGTSLIMQMLHQGGIDCFTDHIREADENNPHGYYEHELVKKLPMDVSWLNQVVNKCVKIISPLLFYLPDKYNYRVIFIERTFDEIALSQKRMLQRKGKKINEANYPLQLIDAFNQNKNKVNNWLNTQKNVSFIKIDFNETVKNPENTTNQIIKFINKPLNKNKMIKAIKPELYRERICTI
jgi:tetratricopeptide (TPR) repeat protein